MFSRISALSALSALALAISGSAASVISRQATCPPAMPVNLCCDALVNGLGIPCHAPPCTTPPEIDVCCASESTIDVLGIEIDIGLNCTNA
ncbi:hypothetical protein HETIRDRAFT_174683 [Heterobasidion irregulare TC 32-1]|uniref:Hydrophobin n=1 Tax=Heterobasidion irregulare (strain TC 32-1) TaxID=747525 RepID=W4JUQ9_HETIT|nr:uncharacterized protein HETIRDRAFT_174683 [Heterobasidion irregulare TC 32-1]ETW76636.1 hypothetical protein HETIRDRAFT_174683 [Heterobasidion irregulare TC 32-1]